MQKNFKQKLFNYFEKVGKRRAATQLRNLGYAEEARKIMENK